MPQLILAEEIFAKESVLKIDKEAVAYNFQVIRQKTAKTVIAVIKENGYGLGLKTEYEILRDLGVEYFALTSAEEALALRRYGATEPILLLSPYNDLQSVEALAAEDITQMLGHSSQAELYRQVCENLGRKPKVHLAIDTGMGRYGFPWDKLPSDLTALTAAVEITGTYSHFNNAEKMTAIQLERFKQALVALRQMGIEPGLTHMSNSAAMMTIGDGGLDAVRVGSVFLGKCARGGGELKTAVWLEAPLCQVREYKKNATIGYLAGCKLKSDRSLGLVKIGHNDGVAIGPTDGGSTLMHGLLHQISLALRPRHYQKYAAIGSLRLPIVGRSGANHTMLDLTGHEQEITIGTMVRFEVNPLYVPLSVPKEIVKGNE